MNGRRAVPIIAAARATDELGITAEAVNGLGAATLRSDVIVTCTPANRWFLGRDHVRPGTFIAAVGADSPGKQELEPELVARTAAYCDLIGQCTHECIVCVLVTRLRNLNCD